jgi:hypothetical protein
MTQVRHPDTVKYPIVHCKYCGRGEQAYFNEPTRDRMVSNQTCFTCMYWEERAERLAFNASRQWPDMVAVTSEKGPMVYAIAGELPRFSGLGRGYGGSEFIIEFDDGRRMASSNMWSGQEVPKLWQNDPRFKPTARLLARSEVPDWSTEFDRLVKAGCHVTEIPGGN